MGLLFSIKAILTVNSPFFLINSFVPSNGSTNQYLVQFFLSFHSTSDSSLKIGIVLSNFCKAFIIILLEAKSALVKGEESSLCVTSISSL